MTEASTSTVGFVISVSDVAQVKIIPERRDIVNRFDEAGDLLTVDRLPGENNVEFRQRQFDLSVNHGGPDYNGLISNLARELGCPRFHAITIDLVTDSSGAKIARNPRVDILADRAVLYENWIDDDTFTVDKEIEFYDIDSIGYYLDDFVKEVNLSNCFTASTTPSTRSNLHTVNLIRGTSYRKSIDEVIFSGEQHKFLFSNIITNSITFTDFDIFKTSVDSEPSSSGEYRIDYSNNYVVSFDLPPGDGTCNYEYNIFPMKVDASLIHIYSLQDENFVNKLFIQETTEGGDVNSLPNAEGSEVYHQLFKETNVFWGK